MQSQVEFMLAQLRPGETIDLESLAQRLGITPMQLRPLLDLLQSAGRIVVTTPEGESTDIRTAPDGVLISPVRDGGELHKAS